MGEMSETVIVGSDVAPGTRDRIIGATLELLEARGREAVSTRAVSALAGVQPPAIYRQFGDKRGLLDAAVTHGFARYLEQKTALERHDDPVDDLRHGWDLHVGFGLANPAIYALMYGDPQPGAAPAAVRAAAAILRTTLERVASAGRLRSPVEHAAGVIHAAGIGVTLALLAEPPSQRDPDLSVSTREAVLAVLTTPMPPTTGPDTTGAERLALHAVAVRALLPDATRLSPAELALLREWLDRLSRSAP